MGWGLLDALTHAMSTLGTGGFSNYDDNAMHFDDVALEGWMTFFMILAGGNFWPVLPGLAQGTGSAPAQYRVQGVSWHSGSSNGTDLNLTDRMGFSLGEAFRYASFQVGSISTNGFVFGQISISGRASVKASCCCS